MEKSANSQKMCGRSSTEEIGKKARKGTNNMKIDMLRRIIGMTTNGREAIERKEKGSTTPSAKMKK